MVKSIRDFFKPKSEQEQSKPLINIEFSDEFQHRLEAVQKGRVTKDSILNRKDDCRQALFDFMAYNFFHEKGIRAEEIANIPACKNLTEKEKEAIFAQRR